MLRTDGGYGVPGMPGNGGVYMAGNPNPLQDPRFRIQGGESPYRQPVLPTERSPEEDIPFLIPGQPQLPMAYGSSNLPGAVGKQSQSPKIPSGTTYRSSFLCPKILSKEGGGRLICGTSLLTTLDRTTSVSNGR